MSFGAIDLATFAGFVLLVIASPGIVAAFLFGLVVKPLDVSFW